MTNLATALVAVVFPTVVFVGVATLQSAHSGRDQALKSATPQNPTPLNMRLYYDNDVVDSFWGALGKSGRVAEQRFLEEDLVFPTLYGGAIAGSLLWLLPVTGLSWRPWLVVSPLVVGVMGDWTENLIQLEQLRRYGALGKNGLDASAIRLSSLATDLKLAGVTLSGVLLLVLVAAFLRRAAAS